MIRWLTTSEFAELAGIDDRNARKALKRAFLNHLSWRGTILAVRLTKAQGGPRGLGYEVRAHSLPTELRDRLKERALAERPLLRIADLRSAKNEWLLLILSPALAQPPRSAERRAAITDILSRPLTDWRGRSITLSERSVLRWLQRYEEQGAAAFALRARADKGHAKVLISLAAERAIPFDDVTWEGIATDLRNYVRGHWKSGATLKLISAHTNHKFRELIEAAGFDHCHTLPEETFIVPRRFIEAERTYRHVHTLYHDRKRYEDNRFRTERSRAGMQPMDWLIGDVHPVDIVMTRPDGSLAHARMIAWLDCATNRMRFNLVLCEPGTGIRNADLIESFCKLVTDPAWGMPKTLYIDNGREYRFAERMDDAMQLVAQLRGDDGRRTRVVHARPYNAAAKPIESMFSALEKSLQDIAGHTGGDRLNKKTETVGRPTLPFSGTVAELEQLIRARITLMEAQPMRGALKGKSPRSVYTTAIANGWQPVVLDPSQILTVFAQDRVCTITKGVITINAQRWTCSELASYFESKIIARMPLYWRPEKIALLHIKTRALIGIAEPPGRFAFDDPAGARQSTEIDKARRAAIRNLDRNAPTIDTMQETKRIAATLLPSPIAEPAATLSVSDEAAEIATRISESPKRRREQHQEKAERAHRARLEILQRNLKKDAG